MPSSGRACRRGTSCFNGSLGTIFILPRLCPAFVERVSTEPSLLQRLRHVLRYRLRLHCSVAFHARGRLRASPMTPTEAFLAPPEAGEIAAARRTAVGCGPQPQKQRYPAPRIIVLFAPGGEFLAVAARAARVSPCALRPNTGLPAIAATAATQGINADDAAQHLRYVSPMRYTRFAATAFRAGKLHFPKPFTK